MRTNLAVQGLSALAHEGRLSLFRALVTAGHAGLSVSVLAEEVGVNVTTASAQLLILAQAGLVEGTRKGRRVVYRADYETIRALLAFLMQDCCRARAEIVAPLAALTGCYREPEGTKP